jgi:hypothetical protein
MAAAAEVDGAGAAGHGRDGDDEQLLERVGMDKTTTQLTADALETPDGEQKRRNNDVCTLSALTSTGRKTLFVH